MIALYLTIISIAYFIAILFYIFEVRYTTKKEVHVRSVQFKLYSLRDRIIRLVAENKIKKDDECFKFVYLILNTSIIHIRLFTLRNLIMAASSADKKMRKKTEALAEDILKKDNELKNIFTDYLDVMIYALIKFSFSLRTYLFIRKYFFHLKPNDNRREHFKRVPIIKNQAETYYLKKDFEDYREKFATAL